MLWRGRNGCARPGNDFLDSTDCAADTNLTDTAASATRVLSAHRRSSSKQRASLSGSDSVDVRPLSDTREWPQSVRATRTKGDFMVRLLALLALAVSCVGCSACGGPGCCRLWGCGSCGGCADECGCGCEDPYTCGDCSTGCCDTGCCDASCDGDCGCEPTCGCSSGNCGCGNCVLGRCGQILRDCPLCLGRCCLFRRSGCDGCYDQCSECGACTACGPTDADYDYSACNNCGCGHGFWPCQNCCGRCCETYSGVCCQPQGPGCCASGDQHYNFNPGPPVGQVAYPYYTVRGPRDFLQKNPAPIGPY